MNGQNTKPIFQGEGNGISQNEVLKQIKEDKSNHFCFDCGDGKPAWASVNNGTIICMTCAGQHRSLGVHISFIKSIELDSWNQKELKMIKSSGNAKLQEFFQKYELQDQSFERYSTQAADFYRNQLKYQQECKEFRAAYPSREMGQQQMQQQKAKTSEQIMENNGKFCSKPIPKKKSTLKVGWSYVSWGAKQIKNKATKSVKFKYNDSSDISEEANEPTENQQVAMKAMQISRNSKSEKQPIQTQRLMNQTEATRINILIQKEKDKIQTKKEKIKNEFCKQAPIDSYSRQISYIA